MSSESKSQPRNSSGIWIGIDLGTTNCTASFWDTQKSRAKLIRFETNLASPKQHSGKNGTIIPSTVLYINSKFDCVGREALNKFEQSAPHNNHDLGESTTAKADDICISSTDISDQILITSVKRIWGLTASQVRSEIELDTTFLSSCPFSTIFHQSENEEKLWINLQQQIMTNTKKNPQPRLIDPIDIAIILLKTIRENAQYYFDNYKYSIKPDDRPYPVGYIEGSETNIVRNCIIGVPAHFSRNRKDFIIHAAKKAGFDGYVSTVVESTAAAMAYGLFVTPQVALPNYTNNNDTIHLKKNVLVFDMGGGTTDITVARMGSESQSANLTKDDGSFRILTTVGDRHLGGDDMDYALAQYISDKYKILAVTPEAQNTQSKNTFSSTAWMKLLRACRKCKEDLCGDGTGEVLPADTVKFSYENIEICITNLEFESCIQHILSRIQTLLQAALSNTTESISKQKITDGQISIHEVVLVGGASRTPSVRKLLQTIFPPPLELCTSIKAEAAVAEGAAIYSAIRSGLVQKHVLRNALMLDVLPHSIGVLVDSSTGCNKNDDDIDELYLPILHKGMVLPAMGYAKFRLADVRQKGITIVAVEDVSDDLPLERIGEFTFLLHRLTEKQYNDMEVGRDNSDEGRMVNVGMTVEVDGKFIVSIFDENDPEHLRKKIKYQEFKKQRQQIDDQGDKLFNLRGPKESGGGGGNHDDSKIQQINSHEAVLISGCILLFVLYLLLRVYFHVPSVTGDDSNNEF